MVGRGQDSVVRESSRILADHYRGFSFRADPVILFPSLFLWGVFLIFTTAQSNANKAFQTDGHRMGFRYTRQQRLLFRSPSSVNLTAPMHRLNHLSPIAVQHSDGGSGPETTGIRLAPTGKKKTPIHACDG